MKLKRRSINISANAMTNPPFHLMDSSSQEQLASSAERKNGFSSVEEIETVEILDCASRPHICGKDAACERKGSTSHCVCPHDKSPPTADLRCPRVTGNYYCRSLMHIFWVVGMNYDMIFCFQFL